MIWAFAEAYAILTPVRASSLAGPPLLNRF